VKRGEGEKRSARVSRTMNLAVEIWCAVKCGLGRSGEETGEKGRKEWEEPGQDNVFNEREGKKKPHHSVSFRATTPIAGKNL